MSALEERRSSIPDLTLDEIFNEEKIRYKRKGYGFFSSVVIALSYFFLFPNVLMAYFPTHIENEGRFEFSLLLVLHTGCFIIFNIMMYLIYHIEHPFFERYKINDRPWPWNNKSDNWDQLLKDSIKTLAFNHFIVLPILSLESLVTGKSHFRCDIESFPGYAEIIVQIIVFMLAEDFLFYWAHRFLHWDRIYGYIHKIHHKYINSISLASEYAHPIEFIVANVLTTNITPLVFGKRTHMITMMMWVILRLGETTDGHCGYEFSWSPYRLIPFSGSSEYHNYHHLNYKGNYSSFFSIWDRVFNTVNKQYDEFKRKKVELCKDYAMRKEKINQEYEEKMKNLNENYEKEDTVDIKKRKHE